VEQEAKKEMKRVTMEFKLHDIRKMATFDYLVREVDITFNRRYECVIESESYSRTFHDMEISLTLVGDAYSIREGMREMDWIVRRVCGSVERDIEWSDV
jgi:hypothetical protein